MLVNASPRTVQILTANQGVGVSSAIILGIFAILGLMGAVLEMLPRLLRGGIIAAIGWTLGIGLLSDLAIQIVRQTMGNPWVGAFFKGKSLLQLTAIYILVIAFVISVIWGAIGKPVKAAYAGLDMGGQRVIGSAGAAIGLAILLILPSLLGTFLSRGAFAGGPLCVDGAGAEHRGRSGWSTRFGLRNELCRWRVHHGRLHLKRAAGHWPRLAQLLDGAAHLCIGRLCLPVFSLPCQCCA